MKMVILYFVVCFQKYEKIFVHPDGHTSGYNHGYQSTKFGTIFALRTLVQFSAWYQIPKKMYQITVATGTDYTPVEAKKSGVNIYFIISLISLFTTQTCFTNFRFFFPSHLMNEH